MNIQIENLKCGGCANAIVKGLSTLAGVMQVTVHLENRTVSVDAPQSLRALVTDKLRAMGYPELDAAGLAPSS